MERLCAAKRAICGVHGRARTGNVCRVPHLASPRTAHAHRSRPLASNSADRLLTPPPTPPPHSARRLLTLYDFYWTPSRCAKILIDKDVPDPPADLFIFVKGAGCRWWGAAWWCAATPPRARAAAPPAATTTSPFNCRQPFGPPNLVSSPTSPIPATHPHPTSHPHVHLPH
ncbi:hypothetical protein RR48_08045 [Papilio machaon]|uniref:Uncharacterized protein n=1 Tax=Papilio machaon TaxID=76193 RepID=A0A194R2J2_PAPMA|nr:hypothetical protein RR48_08045 [Papilio machaon]